jgi:hypothetical protein
VEERGRRLGSWRGSWRIFKNPTSPNVVDKVHGVEIVFSAEEPSSLIGKTIDVTNGKFFIREYAWLPLWVMPRAD